jgi:outer membrane murein-binding lipoprotein Lpp
LVVVTVLSGTMAAAFEAGRVHKSVAELESKVEKVQTSMDALRSDVRADMDALRTDVRADIGKLSDKLDQLLLSFLSKSTHAQEGFSPSVWGARR